MLRHIALHSMGERRLRMLRLVRIPSQIPLQGLSQALSQCGNEFGQKIGKENSEEDVATATKDRRKSVRLVFDLGDITVLFPKSAISQ